MSVIMVTGANGYIGRHTLPALLKKGYQIIACCYGCVEQDITGVHYVSVDLHNDKAVETIIKTYMPSHLLHLAWDVTPGTCFTSLSNLTWLHISVNLIRTFLNNGGQRIVTVGSCAEYAPCQEPLNEDMAIPPSPYLYASSKTSLFYLSSTLATACGAALAHARIFYPYGLDEPAQKVIPHVLHKLLASQPVDVSAGTQIRDYIFIEDVGEALAALVHSDLCGAVNIGTGKGISLRAVFEKMEALTDRRGLIRYGALPVTGLPAPSIVADITKLRRSTKWQPGVSLEDGLRRTIKEFSDKNG